jgi:hypothetical protein
MDLVHRGLLKVQSPVDVEDLAVKLTTNCFLLAGLNFATSMGVASSSCIASFSIERVRMIDAGIDMGGDWVTCPGLGSV